MQAAAAAAAVAVVALVGRMDIWMSEWTNGRANRLRTIYSYSNARSLRSRERKRERTRAYTHLGLEVTAPGLRRGVLRRRFARCAAWRTCDCSFCVYSVSRLRGVISARFLLTSDMIQMQDSIDKICA